MITRLSEAWNRHWFEPDSARNLAVARILAAGTGLWVLLSRDRSGVSALDPVFWSGVPISTRWRFLLFPGHQRLEDLLTIMAVIALLGALLGVGGRASALVAGLLLYHLAPLESIIWTASPYGRGLTLPALTLLVCGMSPSADALAPGSGAPPMPSWKYGWPLRLIQLWLASVYVFAGVAKLRRSGLSWATASNLSNWMYEATQNDLIAVHTRLGTWIAAHLLVAGTLAIGTMLFELGMVTVPFSKRLRPWLAGCALLFHLVIYFAMNITLNSWPLLLALYDWDRRPANQPSSP